MRYDAGVLPLTYRKIRNVHTVAWLFLGLFLAGAFQQIGFIVKKNGGSPAFVALVMTGPFSISMLSLLYVPLFERIRARILVSLPRMLSGGILLFTFVCRDYVSLSVLAFISLSLFSLSNTFYGRLLAELYPSDIRGRMLSLPLFARAVAMIGMSILAGWALNLGQGSYRIFLPVIGLIGVFAAILVLRLPVGQEWTPPVRAGLRQVFREMSEDRAFLVWTLVYSVSTFGYWLVYSAKPVYFEAVLAFDYWQNGLALAFFNGAFCLGFLLSGRLLDRVKSRLIMVMSWILAGLGSAVMLMARKLTVVLLGQVLFGLGMSGNDIAWFTVVLEYAPSKSVDRYMGFYMTVFGARVLSSGLISGALMEVTAGGSFLVILCGSGLMLAGAAGMFLMRPAGRGSH